MCIATRRRFHRSRHFWGEDIQGQNKGIILREHVHRGRRNRLHCTCFPGWSATWDWTGKSIRCGTATPWRNHYRRVTWQTFWNSPCVKEMCVCLDSQINCTVHIGGCCVYQQKALGKMSRVTDYQRVTAELADQAFFQNLPETENNIIAFPLWICCQSLHFRCWACCQLGVRLSSE